MKGRSVPWCRRMALTLMRPTLAADWSGVWFNVGRISKAPCAAQCSATHLKLDLGSQPTHSRLSDKAVVLPVVTACRSYGGDDALRRTNFASGYPYEETYGYSRAVRVGEQVFVSGTTARGTALDEDAYVQARAVLEIITNALAQAGAAPRHIVRTVVYMVDMADAPLVARAHAEYFGAVRPASTLVQVAGLTPATARVEFEVTAVVTE